MGVGGAEMPMSLCQILIQEEQGHPKNMFPVPEFSNY